MVFAKLILVYKILLILLACPLGLWAQGNWDTSFGDSGKLILGEYDYREVRSIEKNTIDSGFFVLQNSNKVTSEGYDSDFALTKFYEDGSLDKSFGRDGTLKSDFIGYDFTSARDFVVAEDGGIFLYGYAYKFAESSKRPSLLMKLNPDGEIDASFGNSGLIQLKFLGNYDQPETIYIDHDNRLLLAGASEDSTEGHGTIPVLARYFQDGTPDFTFGKSGKVKFNYTENVVSITNAKRLHAVGGVFYDVVEMENHKIYAVGSSLNPYNNAFIVRLNKDGSADSTFNTSGSMEWSSSSGHESWMRSATVLSTGELAVAIKTDDADNDFTMGILKVKVFKTLTFDVNGNQDFLEKIVEEHNGDLILLGRTIPNESMNTAAYAYQFSALKINKKGQLQVDFSEDGKFELEIVEGGQEGCNVGVLTDDNSLLLAGKVYAKDLSAIHTGVIKISIDKRVIYDNGGLSVERFTGIFPNPTNGVVNLLWKKDHLPTEVVLMDDLGKLIITFFPEQTEQVLEMDSFSPGVYFLVVKGEGFKQVYKLVKI